MSKRFIWLIPLLLVAVLIMPYTTTADISDIGNVTDNDTKPVPPPEPPLPPPPDIKPIDWDNTSYRLDSVDIAQVHWYGTLNPDAYYDWASQSFYDRKAWYSDIKEWQKTYYGERPVKADYTARSYEVFAGNDLWGNWTLKGASPLCRQSVEWMFGSFGDFIWVDGIKGGGTIVLPSSGYAHVYVATGEWDNPVITETFDYTIKDGKTYVNMPHFSGSGATWYDSWDHRIQFTVDQDDIEAELSNFPVLLYLCNASGIGEVDTTCVFDELTSNDNRKKIAVTTDDGVTECYVEIEEWDDAGEEAWLWVKVPTIASDADTVLYFYYDSGHADNDAYVGDPSDDIVHNVWDSGFKLISHMRDDPDTSHTRDSTVNAKDGTKLMANRPVVTASGMMSDAQDFDGDAEYIDWESNIIGNEFAVEVWAHPTTFDGADAAHLVTVVSAMQTDAKAGYSFVLREAAGGFRVSLYIGNNGAYGTELDSTSIFPLDDYYYIVVTLDSSDVKHIHVDTAGEGTAVDAGATGEGTSANTTTGKRPQLGGRNFDGIIDEVRISDTDRSTGWFNATYESTRDDLVTWGTEEDTPPTIAIDDADDITTSTATLNANITAFNGAEITDRGFEWSTSTGTPYEVNWTENGSFDVGVFDHAVASLNASITYYFRAMAQSDTSYWGYSDENSFTTSAAAFAAPTNFTITKVNVDTVNITWTKHTLAANTTIRVDTDGYPVNQSAGYAVYNGTGSSVLDTGLDLGQTTYYYRAWSYNVTIGFSSDYAQDEIGGDDMMLIALILLPVILMGIGYWRKSIALFITAVLAWTGFAFWNRTLSPEWGTYDTHEILFYVGFFMVIVCLVEGVRVSKVALQDVVELTDRQEYLSDYRAMQGEIDELLTLKPRRRPQPQQKKLPKNRRVMLGD